MLELTRFYCIYVSFHCFDHCFNSTVVFLCKHSMISVLCILLYDEQNKLITVSPSVKYVATYRNIRLRLDATYSNQLGHIVPTWFNMFQPFFAFCRSLSVHLGKDRTQFLTQLVGRRLEHEKSFKYK